MDSSRKIGFWAGVKPVRVKSFTVLSNQERNRVVFLHSAERFIEIVRNKSTRHFFDLILVRNFGLEKNNKIDKIRYVMIQ